MDWEDLFGIFFFAFAIIFGAGLAVIILGVIVTLITK